MKTRINLYVKALQPVKEKLPLSMSLTISGSVLVLTLLVLGSLFWLVNGEKTHQQQLRATLSVEQGHLSKQSAILSEMNNNKVIIEKIKRITQKIQNKKKVLASLKQQDTTPGGFSQLFISLAKVSDQKVWLTEIKSTEGLLTLSGAAKNSRDIPIWVARLNNVAALKGETFSSLTMERDNSVINFVLNNQSIVTTEEQ